MSQFEAKCLCILGRQPALGLAELERLYGAEHVRPMDGAALLDIPAEEINFNNLGGTIKTAKLLAELPYSDWRRLNGYLSETIPQHLRHVPEGKFTLGLSAYGLRVKPAEINRGLLEIKKVIKKSGRPVRVVPNKSPALNSAQVLHNKLTHKGGWELLLVADGQRTLLAQTLFVQDIEAYAARDQARPKRDARIGMLPPKLAQMITNLAVPKGASNNAKAVRVLDPFCGTGVILQEALLMGYSALGSDKDKRMADFSKANIRWLFKKYPNLDGQVSIEVADATAHQWPRFSSVASEVYLGRPLSEFPETATLKKIMQDSNTIAKKFLVNLAPQLKSCQRLCLAVPAWRKPDKELVHLPLLAKLTDMGYNRYKFKHVRDGELVYFREDQVVARELLVLEKV